MSLNCPFRNKTSNFLDIQPCFTVLDVRPAIYSSDAVCDRMKLYANFVPRVDPFFPIFVTFENQNQN